MSYNVAIAKHFESRFRTSSRLDITGSSNVKVFIAFLSFDGTEYMYIKNFTSHPIDISQRIYIGSKSLATVVSSSDIEFIKNADFRLMAFKVMPECSYNFETSESIMGLMEHKNITDSELVIINYTDFTPLKHELQTSDLYDYMYKVDITQYINHFVNDGKNVTIKYRSSFNTLIEATILDNWLYLNDVRIFEKYMNKLEHTIKYFSDAPYQREWDTMAKELNVLLQACDYNTLKNIKDGLKK